MNRIASFQDLSLACERHAGSLRHNSVTPGLLKREPLVQIVFIDDLLHAQRPYRRKGATNAGGKLVDVIPEGIEHIIRWLRSQPGRRFVIDSFSRKALVDF